MKTLIYSLFLLTLLISPVFGVAQEVNLNDSTKQYYLVIKTDGAEYYGEILEDDGREILMLTSTIGKIYINKSEIKSITKLDKGTEITSDGGAYKEFRAEGPFTTRYYFTTNAHPIKEKENYALIHLFGPEVHFGVKDNLSLGVMSMKERAKALIEISHPDHREELERESYRLFH